MRRFVGILLLTAFALARISRAEEGASTFYVQLIRGTNGDGPPVGACHRVGPRLAATLGPVLKWKRYWEICCKSVSLQTGRATRVRLGNGREVEIDLSVPGKRKVTAYQDGVAVDRTISTTGDRMTIAGGERDEQSAWFVVVRRDKPTYPNDPI